jgi:hypothetical protein
MKKSFLLKKEKYIFILIALIFIAFFAYNYFYVPPKEPNSVEIPHYHAEFQVYIDGERKDLSTLDYMYFAPCRVYDFGEVELEEIDRAHFHGYVGDVLHVHDDGVTWRVLLGNLNIEGNLLGYNKEGDLVEGMIDKEIGPYDSVIFSNTELENSDELVGELKGADYVREVELVAVECGA